MDPYAVLGIDRNSSKEDIKKAYRKLAMEFHPDRNKDPGAEERFKEISAAYEALSRQDKITEDPFEAFYREAMEQQMADFFRYRYRRPRPPSSEEDVEVRFEGLSIADIKRGKVGKITYSMSVDCTSCSGLGGSKKEKCVSCSGTGFRQRLSHGLDLFFSQPCDDCSGAGERLVDVCKSCSGSGFSLRKETLEFEIRKK